MKTKFALVNGKRQKPQPGLKGTCEICGDLMDAKCGDIKIHHWAHRGERQCDTWWEPETEWHRDWKNQFPGHWQEVVHTGENGEKHRADVKTDDGWVLEFQRSYLKPDERRSRDTFYQPKLVWVVDGTRRKTDPDKFQNALNRGMPVGRNPLVRKVYSDKCVLLQEWADSDAPIFFDFRGGVLWWRFSKRPNGPVYVKQLPYAAFIGFLRGVEDFEKIVKEFSKVASQLRA